MFGARVYKPLLALCLGGVAVAACFLPASPAAEKSPASYLQTQLSSPASASGVAVAAPVSTNTSNQVYFKQTGHYVRDAFLNYWLMNGGSALYGYPISEEVQFGGKTVQYFERARFEYNAASSRPWHVDLTAAGSSLAEGRSFARADAAQDPSATYYPETGHNLSGAFKQFWSANGGEDKFGLPISEPVQENGKTVQYFERTRLELGSASKVQIGNVGSELLARDMNNGLDGQFAVPLDRPGFEMSFRGDATWFRGNWERIISLNQGWHNLPQDFVGRGLYAAAPADLGLYGRWARVTRGNRSVFVQFVDVIAYKDIPYVRDRGIVIDLGEESFRALGGADGPHYPVQFDVIWPNQEP